ncbi:XRE family transcriptional regulator [Leuconostoc mesenteroides]|nr:XRE family transcriptional regulator [Leuconostoc mesenteroides]
MNRLKELRLERNMSQADVGKLFKITRQTVQRWEVGKSHPNIYQLIALAKYFEVSIDYLVGWVDE